MKNYVLLSDKNWHDSLFLFLSKNIEGNWTRIEERKDFSALFLNNLQPVYIFIPHWSFIIPKDIHKNFNCIVFHMTDLPYGRGGSPLQNLIVRGQKHTMISAIKVTTGLDTGDIYLKRPLDLYGTAEEIFIRASKVIREMIVDIISLTPDPKAQSGEITVFKRRIPDEGNILGLTDLEQVYDFIRMLDCKGYPHAFLEVGELRLEFSRPSLKCDQSIVADVRISKK